MGNKKKVLIGVCAILLLLVNILVFSHKGSVSGEYQLQIGISAEKQQDIQVYYSHASDVWTEASSQKQVYEDAGNVQVLQFDIPSTAQYMRLDLGKPQGVYEITDMSLTYKKQTAYLEEINEAEALTSNHIKSVDAIKDGYSITVKGEDPYLIFELPTEDLYSALEHDSMKKTTAINLLMLLFIDGGAVLAFLLRKRIGTLPMELYQNRALILDLSKNDFKTKYAGSYLGIIWAFIQPIVTILVYWFVFSVGFKAGMASDYPFVLYLVTGMVPWFFFQDALNGGTNALIEYSYLVKKVVFKISILPIVKILSAAIVHVFFIAIALVLSCLYGYIPGVEVIQVIYYSACTFMLVLGLVYATSAIVIFFRDLAQIISIFLQIGVWLTPIMWDINMLANHPMLMKLFKLNPMYYIVSGYREAILGKVWLWNHMGWTLYFWVFTVVLFVLGTVIFKRLKPHFADVL